jgi:hypothetical protein
MTRKLGSVGSLGILAAALLGGTGCSEYKYFDIHVAFDRTMYDIASAQAVSDCQVTVSGKASSTFPLPPGNCPNRHTTMDNSDPLDAGTFEFSSFADSGNLIFTVATFAGLGKRPECKSGEGSTTVPVVSASMIKGEVVIKKTGTELSTCNNVTPPTGTADAGP